MRFFLIVLISFFIALPAKAAPKPVAEEQGPNVEIWLPPDFRSGKGPWPLIIFSHGFGGCAKQSTFLTSYLAEQGYIVAAPDHRDARACNSMDSYAQNRTDTRLPEKPFRFPEQWNESVYTDRRDDILFTLKSILNDPQFKGYVDEDHIGLMGHSLGGYTALGMAGAWPSWKDARFKAVLALSPYADPFVLGKTLQNISVPVMYMGGTKDDPITPVLKRANGAYAQTKAPKYFIELNGAGHFSFTELDKRFEDIIDQEALAFFGKYLKGENSIIAMGKRPDNVATFWEDEKPKAP